MSEWFFSKKNFDVINILIWTKIFWRGEVAMAPPRRTLSTGPPSIVSGGEDDQRFAELLRPIKDLTENWQVPLARYLEEYYDELHDIQISLDGQTTKVSHRNYSRGLIWDLREPVKFVSKVEKMNFICRGHCLLRAFSMLKNWSVFRWAQKSKTRLI